MCGVILDTNVDLLGHYDICQWARHYGFVNAPDGLGDKALAIATIRRGQNDVFRELLFYKELLKMDAIMVSEIEAMIDVKYDTWISVKTE
jgi:hypothetical protein